VARGRWVEGGGKKEDAEKAVTVDGGGAAACGAAAGGQWAAEKAPRRALAHKLLVPRRTNPRQPMIDWQRRKQPQRPSLKPKMRATFFLQRSWATLSSHGDLPWRQRLQAQRLHVLLRRVRMLARPLVVAVLVST